LTPRIHPPHKSFIPSDGLPGYARRSRIAMVAVYRPADTLSDGYGARICVHPAPHRFASHRNDRSGQIQVELTVDQRHAPASPPTR